MMPITSEQLPSIATGAHPTGVTSDYCLVPTMQVHQLWLKFGADEHPALMVALATRQSLQAGWPPAGGRCGLMSGPGVSAGGIRHAPARHRGSVHRNLLGGDKTGLV
jgi:hypothetical protein